MPPALCAPPVLTVTEPDHPAGALPLESDTVPDDASSVTGAVRTTTPPLAARVSKTTLAPPDTCTSLPAPEPLPLRTATVPATPPAVSPEPICTLPELPAEALPVRTATAPLRWLARADSTTTLPLSTPAPEVSDADPATAAADPAAMTTLPPCAPDDAPTDTETSPALPCSEIPLCSATAPE